MILTDKTVQRRCPMCEFVHFVQVNADHYQRWIDGDGYIQDLMFYLSADEREVLISGICPTCWDKQFDEDEV